MLRFGKDRKVQQKADFCSANAQFFRVLKKAHENKSAVQPQPGSPKPAAIN